MLGFWGSVKPKCKLKLIIKFKKGCFLFGSSQLIFLVEDSAPGSF